MTEWLVVMAMPEESRGLLEKAGADVIYTGLGKVNATHALTSALHKRRSNGGLPKGVLNLGTAGSHVFPAASLLECIHFVQHDMDVSPLGFPIGTTPFEQDPPAKLSVGKTLTKLTSATCHSGDRFITARAHPPMEAIDMEAYALAKVCYREGVDFSCIKFVSDGADGAAAADWAKTLEQASVALSEIFRSIC